MKAGLTWFLDSGAFTFQKMPKLDVPSLLDQYAAFTKKQNPKPEFYVNFDYVKDCPTIKRMQAELEKRGLKPVPVYHGDNSLSYLRGYLDAGYPRIAIGKPPGNTSMYTQEMLYDRCFSILANYPKVKVHGFGVTGMRIFNYPWDSVDSTSWLKAAIRGCIILLDGRRKLMNVFHVGTEREGGLWRKHIGHMSSGAQEQMHTHAKRYEIPWKNLQSSIMWRSVFNAKSYIEGMTELTTIEGGHEWESLL